MLRVFMILRCKIYFMRAHARQPKYQKAGWHIHTIYKEKL